MLEFVSFESNLHSIYWDIGQIVKVELKIGFKKFIICTLRFTDLDLLNLIHLTNVVVWLKIQASFAIAPAASK